MKIVARILLAGVVLFALLQCVRPGVPTKTAATEIQAPPAVRKIIEKDCYSCHSDEKRLAWFDQIVPAYWLVRHDILRAREHLNFTALTSKPAAAQRSALFEAVNMIQLGAMPLPRFVALHRDARVTPEELATLKTYLAPWSQTPARSASAPATETDTPAAVSLASVPPEFNRLPFESDFESWKLISATDRGDNNTFRFILGNDIAVKAAASGNISPWPDGTRLAKIAWQQELGEDALVHPGKFVQVEFMVKDAQRYKDTDGWGWGRWRGIDLKPYGDDAHFAKECMGCHRPVRGDDYVYTLPISAAKTSRAEVVNNNAAGLPTSLPFQPQAWSAITLYIDPAKRTMALLYGNDVAAQAVRSRSGGLPYPAGSVLALVTWAQREDPHWFGARIPDKPRAVEFVQVATAGLQSSYRRFAGEALTEDASADGGKRIEFIQNLAPAQLP
jgi:hypothetical protein